MEGSGVESPQPGLGELVNLEVIRVAAKLDEMEEQNKKK